MSLMASIPDSAQGPTDENVSRRQLLTRTGLLAAGVTVASTALDLHHAAGAVVSSTTIQTMIDALPPEGGIVQIPVGDYEGPRLQVRDGVILQGQGWNTIIPPFVQASTARAGISLRDLAVDFTNVTVEVPPQHYALDWRYISNGSVSNVRISGGTHGLLVDFSARHNVFTGVIATASEVAVELFGAGDDQPLGNTFVGGRFTAPTPLLLAGSGIANTIVGAGLEGSTFPGLAPEGGRYGDRLVSCYFVDPNGNIMVIGS